MPDLIFLALIVALAAATFGVVALCRTLREAT